MEQLLKAQPVYWLGDPLTADLAITGGPSHEFYCRLCATTNASPTQSIAWWMLTWPKEKVQKEKQRSTKHTHTTKDRVTRTLIKTGVNSRCSGRVSSSCSTQVKHNKNITTFILIANPNPIFRAP
jgi:hypothetical protein